MANFKKGDYVQFLTGKYAGLKTAIKTVSNNRIYFYKKGSVYTISWTPITNAVIVREEYMTRTKVLIHEYYYAEVIQYFADHKDAGIWLDNNKFFLVSDINDGDTEIALVRQNTFDKLRKNNIIGKNIYGGFKARRIYPAL